jgi:hypothetical protein
MRAYFEFVGALTTLAGAMAWWRRDTPEEDAAVVAATDVVLEALSDGDRVERVNCVQHKNMRDAVSVQEAIDMASEAELRRFGWKRN